MHERELCLDAADCGISDDFTLSPTLAKIFKDNKHIIEQRLPLIQKALNDHRHYFAQLAESKKNTLSYEFLLKIHGDVDLSLGEMQKVLHDTERSPLVRQMPQVWMGSMILLQERMKYVCRR